MPLGSILAAVQSNITLFVCTVGEPAGPRAVRVAPAGVLAGARVLAARAVRAAAGRRRAGGQPRRRRHAQPGRVDRQVLPRRRRLRARRQRRVHAHGHCEYLFITRR